MSFELCRRVGHLRIARDVGSDMDVADAELDADSNTIISTIKSTEADGLVTKLMRATNSDFLNPIQTIQTKWPGMPWRPLILKPQGEQDTMRHHCDLTENDINGLYTLKPYIARHLDSAYKIKKFGLIREKPDNTIQYKFHTDDDAAGDTNFLLNIGKHPAYFFVSANKDGSDSLPEIKLESGEACLYKRGVYHKPYTGNDDEQRFVYAILQDQCVDKRMAFAQARKELADCAKSHAKEKEPAVRALALPEDGGEVESPEASGNKRSKPYPPIVQQAKPKRLSSAFGPPVGDFPASWCKTVSGSRLPDPTDVLNLSNDIVFNPDKTNRFVKNQSDENVKIANATNGMISFGKLVYTLDKDNQVTTTREQLWEAKKRYFATTGGVARGQQGRREDKAGHGDSGFGVYLQYNSETREWCWAK